MSDPVPATTETEPRPAPARRRFRPSLVVVLALGVLGMVWLWRDAPNERRLVLGLGPNAKLDRVELSCADPGGATSGQRWTFDGEAPGTLVHTMFTSHPVVGCDVTLQRSGRGRTLHREVDFTSDEARLPLERTLFELAPTDAE